jgi:hypothetical protein
LGNPFAKEKEMAHMGLVANPGNLHIARLTCGSKDCHPDLPKRVEKSLMATNQGILRVMQNLWPHESSESVQNVKELMDRSIGKSLALDHFRKMCGGCHLWRPRYPKLGEIGQRGGGCTDCHIQELASHSQDLSKKRFQHPGLTTCIPNNNCLKCHNRSARIGLSYTGRYESEGYGTPFRQGEPGPRSLSGNRFYLELPGDVHHMKSGMDCIDCHTEKGVMGDGEIHLHQEQQVDITCKTCHEPVLKEKNSAPELASRLARLNQRQPLLNKGPFVDSPKGSPIYHLHTAQGMNLKLFRKRDGKEILFKRLEMSSIHKAPYHERLSCQACHSAWTPQCYGCHETLFEQASQRGWLTGKKWAGRWIEGRSYLRFRRPTLGLWPDGQIGPFAPGCQVFLEVFDKNGDYQPAQTFRSLVMASFDPHTTASGAPDCFVCHRDPKTLGLGEGALKVTEKGLEFEPVFQSVFSGLGIDFPLDAFVSAEGKPLQIASRDKSRPFNKEELTRITRVGLCIPCHDQYDDPIYRAYDQSMSRFRSGTTPCRKEMP